MIKLEENKKKAQQTMRSSIGGDPAYMDFDFYPSMRGSFRLHMPHYFNMVLYMQEKKVYVPDEKHVKVLNVVRNGEYYSKNVWQHEWDQAELPTELYNVMWPELWEQLTTAHELYDPEKIEA